MNRHSPLRVVAVAGLVTGVLASSAQAETAACTAITNALIPYTITVPGIYCLTEDIGTAMTTGHVIEIQASSVVLDLNGHRIGGLGAGPGTSAIGVYASKRQNITITNGTIRGFLHGVYLSDTQPLSGSMGHVIEGLRVDQCTYGGIHAIGRGLVVRNNHVIATGGSTLSPNSSAFGISVKGPGNRVLDNDVVTVTPVGNGDATGIAFGLGSDGLAVNNRITGAHRGIQFSLGTGKYRDNVTSGVAIPFTGGTDVGNNN